MSAQGIWGATVASVVATGIATGALAQTPVQPQPRDPNMPAPQNTIPERVAPGAGSSAGSAPTLSDKLEATGGVITPPSDISPSMTVRPPVPDPGTTPVIPPAGTPGSARPNVEPR